MNAKKIIIGSAAILTAASGAYFTYLMKRALTFKRSLDHTPDSLDDCVIFCGKHKTTGSLEMKDCKLGAFCGSLSVDFSQIEAPHKQYDMDIEVQSGCVSLIVPETFQVDVGGNALMSAVVDITKSPAKKSKTLLSVSSNVNCGALIIKNPDTTIENADSISD